MITKVFPDEFHLHTLDLLLSAIARLNPYVDLKKIVIGLMDRLSAFAARETESAADPKTRKNREEKAVAKLLEKLDISEESKEGAAENTSTGAAQENDVEQVSTEPTDESKKPEGEEAKSDGANPNIPSDVALYSIFYDQVVNLIQNRGLPIQDTMALLVSLVNLALNTYPDQLEYVDKILGFATQKTNE